MLNIQQNTSHDKDNINEMITALTLVIEISYFLHYVASSSFHYGKLLKGNGGILVLYIMQI